MRGTPERLLARLEWRVIHRLDGRLAGGDYRTAHRGSGTDLVGQREYTEGDDARHIDWNVTARRGEPQLRVFTEDRELTAWLVLDRSASMTVGPPGRGKDDVLSYYRDGLAASPGLSFSLIEVCTGVDDVTIVYRNHRDVLVTEALTFGDDGLVSEVRVSYGA